MTTVCVECKKNRVDDIYRPFCSKRCADVDLHRWTTGAYAIASIDDESHAPPDDTLS